MKSKSRVLRVFKDAYCVRLNDGSGYIVWPGKIQPRGFEQPAIGFGATAQKAWESIKIHPPKYLKSLLG